MKIIEIKALPNGAHRIQKWNSKNIPKGFAVIPDGMVIENSPFGEVIVAELDGVMTVINWVPSNAPRPFPNLEDEPNSGAGTIEQLRADVDYIAIMTGVEL